MKENLTFSQGVADPVSKLMFQMLGSFAEFERNLIRERQAEGIRIAKAAGKYKGRSALLSPDQVDDAREKIESGSTQGSRSRQARCQPIHPVPGSRGARP